MVSVPHLSFEKIAKMFTRVFKLCIFCILWDNVKYLSKFTEYQYFTSGLMCVFWSIYMYNRHFNVILGLNMYNGFCLFAYAASRRDVWPRDLQTSNHGILCSICPWYWYPGRWVLLHHFCLIFHQIKPSLVCLIADFRFKSLWNRITW